MNNKDHACYAVASIIEDPKRPQEVLLGQMRHDPGKTLSGEWHHPGGKTEPGEDVSNAAVREIKEETNLGIEFLGIICVTLTSTKLSDGSTRFRATFWTSCRVLPSSAEIKVGSDLDDLRWLPKNRSVDECGPTARERIPEEVRQFLGY